MLTSYLRSSTPWLTTRRRTCPICKGDVVRSLAAATASSVSPPPRPSYHSLSSSAVAARVGSFLGGGAAGGGRRRRRSRRRSRRDDDDENEDDPRARDDDDDDYDSQDDRAGARAHRAAATVRGNEGSTMAANANAARPVSRAEEADEDLERGIGVDRDR